LAAARDQQPAICSQVAAAAVAVAAAAQLLNFLHNSSKIRNQKPVPNLKLATRLSQIKNNKKSKKRWLKQTKRCQASKLDVKVAAASASAAAAVVVNLCDCTFFVV